MPLILVAEDDRMISLLVCAIVRRAGWDAVPTFNAAQTVARVSQEPAPDAILLDMHLGDGTAADVVRSLGALPTARSIPVLLLTGATDEQLGDLRTSASVSGVLRKPVEPEAVVAGVRRALGGAHA